MVVASFGIFIPKTSDFTLQEYVADSQGTRWTVGFDRPNQLAAGMGVFSDLNATNVPSANYIGAAGGLRLTSDYRSKKASDPSRSSPRSADVMHMASAKSQGCASVPRVKA